MPHATLRLALVTPAEYRVLIDAEPVGTRAGPLVLDVFAETEPPTRFALSGRSTIAIALRSTHPRVAEIELRVEQNGGTTVIGARGPAYKVFRVSLHALLPDVGGFDFFPGPGWCFFERSGGEIFRWAGDEVVLVRTSAKTAVELDLEPGPGVVEPPLKLGAFAQDGTELATLELSGRERITIPLHACPTEVRQVILRAARPGRVTLDDARVLNFRAFATRPASYE